MAKRFLIVSLLSLVIAIAAVAIYEPPAAEREAQQSVDSFRPSIAIADTSDALSFARLNDAAGGVTLLVTGYGEGYVSGYSLAAIMRDGEDAVDLVNRLGYDQILAALEGMTARGAEALRANVATLAIPVRLGEQHIAAGTNFREHAEEASVEGGPFLFPKYVQPTGSRAPIPHPGGLLDYEVELCLTVMQPLAPGSPVSGGLLLCNDVTDRAALLAAINPDEPESGDGFTTGKSGPGFLPVGDLFVVPRDMDDFIDGIALQLSVNGEERQASPASMWIWDFGQIIDQAAARRDTVWRYGDSTARMAFDTQGHVPARTLILGGTPAGTVFQGLASRFYVRGVLDWLFGGWDQGVANHVIARYATSAARSNRYLRTGDLVTISVDRMGSLANRVE